MRFLTCNFGIGSQWAPACVVNKHQIALLEDRLNSTSYGKGTTYLYMKSTPLGNPFPYIMMFHRIDKCTPLND